MIAVALLVEVGRDSYRGELLLFSQVNLSALCVVIPNSISSTVSQTLALSPALRQRSTLHCDGAPSAARRGFTLGFAGAPCRCRRYSFCFAALRRPSPAPFPTLCQYLGTPRPLDSTRALSHLILLAARLLVTVPAAAIELLFGIAGGGTENFRHSTRRRTSVGSGQRSNSDYISLQEASINPLPNLKLSRLNPEMLNFWRTQHSPQGQQLQWRRRCGRGGPLSS